MSNISEILTRNQWIGMVLLLAMALGVLVWVNTTHPAGQQEAISRYDSLHVARHLRDSLRQARYEWVCDSFATIRAQRDSAKAAREQRYKAFGDSIAELKRVRDSLRSERRLRDSLWRDSIAALPHAIKKDTVLELNTADTTTLTLIRGIGIGRAKQIIRRRTELGGFVSVNQIRDLVPADSVLRHFVLNPDLIQKIRVNKVSDRTLFRHPYVRTFEQAEEIYDLRRRKVRLHSIDDLRVIPCLTDSDLILLAPYLSFE